MARKTIKKKIKKKTAVKKPWAGRFSGRDSGGGVDKLAEEMNASINFDKRLFHHDIQGSIAHTRALRRARVLTVKEEARIIKGLRAVENDIINNRCPLSIELEDIHMAVESHLTKKIGALGGKLHTGRSRNDQVALDLRLYLKDEIAETLRLVRALRKALLQIAKRYKDVVMPGYTHLQRAQPVLFAHHMLAYVEMFERDESRFIDSLKRVDVMPLGSGALAGSPYDIDRRYVAKLLGFSKISENSLDAVSDRDFAIEYLSNASLLMMHLSRFSEELILWSSSEFGFVELSDSFSTGSSIMPQKKNPDLAELTRGKTGRVYGNLFTLLTVMKALPLAYNKDMQEDKEPLFDTIDTVKAVLSVFAPMLTSMKVNKLKTREATVGGFLTATDVADYLVSSGVAFRKAHEVTGKIVAYCIDKGKNLEELAFKEWQGFSKAFSKDILKVVKVESSLNARRIYGGTATVNVHRRLRLLEKSIKTKN
jgi:argininosuccinate lyase